MKLNIYYKIELIKDNKLKLFLINNIDCDDVIKYTSKEKEEIIKKYELLNKYYESINNNFNVSLEKIHNLNKFEKYINNSLYDYILLIT